ncbi:hypothetical protein [uncultured Flavobacterium sp.]|uniref:hypothetical protein n=1 Tax=uncultured Flavobacterium sp. TaxID=165435 RepID=UPI00292D603A|nr:hypothetical protein [uncultured Flavobacterium sp.]
MKNSIKIFLLLLLLRASIGFAQVGMNSNNADKSTALEMTNSNKGLLMTSVALSNTTDVSGIVGTPANSLLIYNTNPSITGTGAAGSGYYYWSVSLTRWNKLAVVADGSDNLGNHKATQNLQMGSNLISNDGAAGKGLSFGDSGDATLLKQLTIKNIPVSLSGDNVLSINSNGDIRQLTPTQAGAASTAFFDYGASGDISYSGNSGKVLFDSKLTDVSNTGSLLIDNSKGYTIFTAPVTGYYSFGASVYQASAQDATRSGGAATFLIKLNLYNETSDANVASTVSRVYSSYVYSSTNQYIITTLKLNEGDKLSLGWSNNFNEILGTTAGTIIRGNATAKNLTYFTGRYMGADE